MSHLFEGVEVCRAAFLAAKEGIEGDPSGSSMTAADVRDSRLLLMGVIGIEIFANWPRHRSPGPSVFRRAAHATAVLMTGLALWNSRKLLHSAVASAGPAVHRTLDQQWLRAHPITYA
jgi:hypothetical protein